MAWAGKGFSDMANDKYCTINDVFRTMPSLRDDFRLGESATNEALVALIEEATITAKTNLQGRYNLASFDGSNPDGLPTSIRTMTAIMVAQLAVSRYGSGADSKDAQEQYKIQSATFRALARNGSL